MFYSILEQFDLMLTEGETGLIGFDVSPIRKRDYRFLCFQSGESYRLLAGAHTSNKLLRFVKEFVGDEFAYEVFQRKIMRSREFLSAYRKAFYQQVDIQNPIIIDLIQKACAVDLDTPAVSRWGLDGFSLECQICGQTGRKLMWCHYSDSFFIPLAELANIFLLLARVPVEYLFRYMP